MKTTKLPNLNKNQLAILTAVSVGITKPQQIADAPSVCVGATSVYNSLRALKDRGLVLEKQTRKGSTPKGRRVEFVLSAKGKKQFAKI